MQGLLTIDLMLDDSEARCVWKGLLPNQSSFEQAFPFWWDQAVQRLLPEVAMKLVDRQKDKLGSDWATVSKAFPLLSKVKYTYYWFTVGTRTFYYTDSTSDTHEDPDECLALVPFADYFNHASEGCHVTYSGEAYNFTANKKISTGEEIFVSYGEHSNDFLLAEYGFVLENNKNDSVALDPVLLDLFDDNNRKILESNSFWAGYVLDNNHVCYRTEVAVRLLCMPIGLWQKSLEEGFDENDDYRTLVDRVIRKSLKKYSLVARHMIREVAELDPRYSVQQAMLRRRWEQISLTVDNALFGLNPITE